MIGWTRLSSPKASKTAQVWIHDASGIVVEHCGHMTAHHPWTGIDPRRPEALLVSGGGRAFGHLHDALTSIAEWFAGSRESVERTWTPKALPPVPLVCILEPGRTAAEELAVMAAREGLTRGGRPRKQGETHA